MSTVDVIRSLSTDVFGIVDPDYRTYTWSRMRKLVKQYGRDRVVKIFEDWAVAHASESFNGYPVAAFLKEAHGLLRGSIAIGNHPDLGSFLSAALVASNGTVTFDKHQQSKLNRLLKKYGNGDLFAAFAFAFSRVTEGRRLPSFGQDFLQRADYYVRVIRERREHEARHKETVSIRMAEDHAKGQEDIGTAEEEESETEVSSEFEEVA